MSLVQHVCKEAPGLESLFLISKSNCAFANYKDEAACVEAQQKLHDSKFYTVRLVSRLRKSTVEGAGGATAPTGPAASSSASATTTSTAATTPAEELSTMSPKPTSVPGSPVGTLEQPAQMQGSKPADAALKDRFFILKSLTVEDLELSVGTGIWATQSHNEQALNSAFKVSANKHTSGVLDNSN